MHSIMQSKARVKVLKLIFWAIECKKRMHESSKQMHSIDRQSVRGDLIFVQHEPLSRLGSGEALRSCHFWCWSHGHGCEGGPCVKMPSRIKSENSNYIECNQSMHLDVLRGLFGRQRSKPPIPSAEKRRLTCASPASKGNAWISFSPITAVSLLASSTCAPQRNCPDVRLFGIESTRFNLRARG